MFIAQVLVGPRKPLKQVFQIEHNIVKYPNWPEANQLAIYNRGREFEGWSASPTRWPLGHASTVLLLYGNTDMKKMTTAVHDNDFAQKSKWEFQSINFFRSSWKEVETKLASSKLYKLSVK